MSSSNPYANSLVRYSSPQLVGLVQKKRQMLAARRPGALRPVANRQTTQTEDILNSILPPRQWDDGVQVWTQHVSYTPATRLDVINLQEQLDRLLLARKAKETGICPVREELYSQCFDELIRQVTIKCAERGLLLLRIRDELRMTQRAYQTLYESSVAFGMRKALQAEQGKRELRERVAALERENRILENRVAELETKYDTLEKREIERRKQDEKKHKAEIDYFKKQVLQYKGELEAIMSLQTQK